MAKVKAKVKTIQKYVVTLTEQELKVLHALTDFPEWAAQDGEVQAILERLNGALWVPGVSDNDASDVFVSSQTSFKGKR